MRILVAEDDAPLAEFLRQRLEQEQFSVKMVSNGLEAEQLASGQPYDLVILDLNLPGAGGLEVLRLIHSKKPDLPVLMVTDASMVEQVRKLDHDTTTNVVDVYINYLRRKVDAGYGHTLIRTIRGVGYQIGGNGQHL